MCPSDDCLPYDEPFEGPWENEHDEQRPYDEAKVADAPTLPLKRASPVNFKMFASLHIFLFFYDFFSKKN